MNTFVWERTHIGLFYIVYPMCNAKCLALGSLSVNIVE